jgi:hypothetical protein
MNQNYLVLSLAMLFTQFVSAQNDTLLWEDFEAETIDYIELEYPNGEPNLYPIWLNFDIDGLGDGSESATERPDEWFLSFGFADVDTTNTVLASNSWVFDNRDGAENWLISPRVHIQDNLANLYWKSAPFQLPRYIDGYQVLVSTTDNFETSFTDTLAVFAEFDGDETSDIEDTLTYVFTDGIMHTELQIDLADRTRHTGVLQQWEASLAAYQGQNIFIAFRHQSDDDNLLSIDDILVLGTGTVGIEENDSDVSLGIYPNPTSGNGNITLEYELKSRSNISYSILGVDGKLLSEVSGHTQLAGAHRSSLDVSALAAGTYFIKLKVNNRFYTKQLFVIN